MLERHNPKPLYAQLYDILREKIESQYWKPHNPIPSEGELSKEYGVSRLTARTVILEFVREGIMYRVPGKGTFVSEPKQNIPPPLYAGIRKRLEHLAEGDCFEAPELQKIVPPLKIRSILRSEAGSQAYMLKRLRLDGDARVGAYLSYFPTRFYKGLENAPLATESIRTILEGFGHRRKQIVETMETVYAAQSDAKLLLVEKGDALQQVTNTVFNESDEVIEYTRILFRNDVMPLQFVHALT